MKLDLTSWMIRLTIKRNGGTPSWGTALGQGKDYAYSFENQNEYCSAMEKCKVDPTDIEYSLGKGGTQNDKYDLKRAAVFKSIFVWHNGKQMPVENASFLIIEVEETKSVHAGRKSIKYSPKYKYKNNYINNDCNNRIEKLLGITKSDGWFVSNIEFINDEELHLTINIVKGKKNFENLSDRRKAMNECINRQIVSHYTTLESAISIISGVEQKDKTKYFKFRATRFDCLNDPNECKYGSEMYETIFEGKKAPVVTPYILSFCKDSDNPIMWRLYHSKIQFVFNKNKIENEIKQMQIDGIDYCCNDVLYAVVSDIKTPADFKKETSTEITEENAKNIISCLKPTDFEIEKEWRVWASENKDYQGMFKDIQNRVIGATSRYGLVKMYREIPIPSDSLAEIIVYEFSQDQFELIKNQLDNLLKGIGLSNVIISQTNCASIR